MKCDELKDYDYDPDFPFQSRGRFYVADEVEAAIDELKTENETLLQQNRELCRALQVMYTKEEYDKLKAENAELKQKLEDAKATAYAESVDAGMENRRLKRELWLARAEKARFLAMIIDQHPYTQVLHFTSRKRDDSGKPLGIARTAMEWWRMFKEVERKCLKKSEQYK